MTYYFTIGRYFFKVAFADDDAFNISNFTSDNLLSKLITNLGWYLESVTTKFS